MPQTPSEKITVTDAPQGQLVGFWGLPRSLHCQAGVLKNIFKDGLNKVILVIQLVDGETVNYPLPPDAALLLAREMEKAATACEEANNVLRGQDPNKHLCEAKQ